MQEIGRSDCVLVVLSEKYLRSIYFMRELLYLYQSSLGIQDVFLNKLVLLTVGDVRFSCVAERAEHVHYWEEEEKKLDATLTKLDRLSISADDRAELLAMKDFAHRVSEILSWVSRILMPRGTDLHTRGIDAAIDLILQRTQTPSRKSRHFTPPSSVGDKLATNISGFCQNYLPPKIFFMVRFSPSVCYCSAGSFASIRRA
jgi:internalin A